MAINILNELMVVAFGAAAIQFAYSRDSQNVGKRVAMSMGVTLLAIIGVIIAWSVSRGLNPLFSQSELSNQLRLEVGSVQRAKETAYEFAINAAKQEGIGGRQLRLFMLVPIETPGDEEKGGTWYANGMFESNDGQYFHMTFAAAPSSNGIRYDLIEIDFQPNESFPLDEYSLAHRSRSTHRIPTDAETDRLFQLEQEEFARMREELEASRNQLIKDAVSKKGINFERMIYSARLDSYNVYPEVEQKLYLIRGTNQSGESIEAYAVLKMVFTAGAAGQAGRYDDSCEAFLDLYDLPDPKLVLHMLAYHEFARHDPESALSLVEFRQASIFEYTGDLPGWYFGVEAIHEVGEGAAVGEDTTVRVRHDMAFLSHESDSKTTLQLIKIHSSAPEERYFWRTSVWPPEGELLVDLETDGN